VGLKTVITYGTFDLLHSGHICLLERLRELGDRLVVGVSSDEFNALKGKQTLMGFSERSRVVASLRCVDKVLREDSWEQKRSDITQEGAVIFGMGSDWINKFDDLRDLCEVVYLPRTDGISSSYIKEIVEGRFVEKILKDIPLPEEHKSMLRKFSNKSFDF
jgi:glycerol-3-phosphate cytidylyltransferase